MWFQHRSREEGKAGEGSGGDQGSGGRRVLPLCGVVRGARTWCASRITPKSPEGWLVSILQELTDCRAGVSVVQWRGAEAHARVPGFRSPQYDSHSLLWELGQVSRIFQAS